ncbi:MAG: hypothetical protein HYZ92_00770 [Candidatus Omnitrophica bacterium]|nr:hypothetical protein [Candidatus Omnitrophota bacterium]
MASRAVSGTLKLRAGTVPGEVRGEREVSSIAARHGRRLRRRRHFLAIPPLRGGTPGSVAETRQRCREPHASQALLPRAIRQVPGGFDRAAPGTFTRAI